MALPNDLILLLSGVSCVGKTSTAYNLIKSNSYFKSVNELDVYIEVLKEMVKKQDFNEDMHTLFYSPALIDFSTLKRHSRLLVDFVRIIIERQKNRKIPSIIEGTGIVPSVYFENNEPLSGFSENIVFINLYISDEKEHIKRRYARCKSREYKEDMNEIITQVKNIRDKNLKLHTETLELSKRFRNVFSIDVSMLNEEEIVFQIETILNQIFTD